VESNDLVAEEVIAVLESGGELDVPLAVGGLAEPVDSPDTTAQALLLDLEPVEAVNVGDGASVVDLGEVRDDGTLVGLGNWV